MLLHGARGGQWRGSLCRYGQSGDCRRPQRRATSGIVTIGGVRHNWFIVDLVMNELVNKELFEIKVESLEMENYTSE